MPDPGTPVAPAGIDRSVLARLVNHDPAKFSRFALKFVETSRATLAEIQLARGRSDLIQVGRLAHRLKSAAATVGAGELAGLCRRLEAACHAVDDRDAARLADSLAPALKLIESELTGGTGP